MDTRCHPKDDANECGIGKSKKRKAATATKPKEKPDEPEKKEKKAKSSKEDRAKQLKPVNDWRPSLDRSRYRKKLMSRKLFFTRNVLQHEQTCKTLVAYCTHEPFLKRLLGFRA
jgi:hypothetical protein